MKKTKKLLILVIAVIFCTSCGMFGLSDSAWSEVFEKRNSMPQNSLEEKLKNPEMVYQTVDGKLYFREGGKIDVYEKNSTEKEKITSDVVSYFVYNGKIYCKLYLSAIFIFFIIFIIYKVHFINYVFIKF